MSTLKPIPAFKSEAEERKFWETHDSTDYVDWSKAERVRFPNLKPSTSHRVSKEDIKWLRHRRASLPLFEGDSVALIREMRDEE